MVNHLTKRLDVLLNLKQNAMWWWRVESGIQCKNFLINNVEVRNLNFDKAASVYKKKVNKSSLNNDFIVSTVH